MEEFQLSKFTKEGAELLKNITEEFKRLGIDTSKLPKTFPDDSGKIKLVFVGQYSAGKSSIIKMLTGEDVAIGAKITTQNSKPYLWNGLEIIDTPGIHTELRPDHDEITYNQINHAALLIFVITNEGFSQRMGDHFRELAIDQKRAGNMVLVVNKMDRTALGNCTEQQEIIYEDLKKVTAPYDPKDLYLSFLDTSAYFDSLEETDAEIKADLLDTSGHDTFVKNLNRFVAEKGVLQKINLPLNTLAAAIREASGENETSEDTAKFINTIKERKKIFIDNQRYCNDDISGVINECRREIISYGRKTADEILNQKDSNAASDKAYEAQEYIPEIANKYSKEIAENIQKFATNTQTDINNYENTSYVQQINKNFLSQFDMNDPKGFAGELAKLVGSGAVSGGAWISANGATVFNAIAKANTTPLGESLAGLAEGAIQIFGKQFSSLSGNAGNVIRNLPFFQDRTFITKIANVFKGDGAKLLGGAVAIVGAVAGAYMQHKEDEAAKERERKRNKIRQDIVANFEDIANQITQKMTESVRNWMDTNITPIVDGMNNEIKALENKSSNSKIQSEKLAKMLTQTENLIAEIESKS